MHKILSIFERAKNLLRLTIFRHVLFYFFLLLSISGIGYCQEIPLGTWRTHFSYHSATTLALAENKVYSGSESGFFYFEKEFNSPVIQSKINGFSEITVSNMKYSPAEKTLLIIYSNGNIDLLQEGEITNLPAIRDANQNLSKTIHHI